MTLKGQQSINLTPREQQVLDLICQGLGEKDIAVALGGITLDTVKKHTGAALLKMNCSSRLEMAVRVLNQKIDELRRQHDGPSRDITIN